MELFFDTETTDKALFKDPHDHPGQPDIIQLACILSTEDEIFAELKCIIDPTQANPGWQMGAGAELVHGISREMCLTSGVPTRMAMMAFAGMLVKADTVVCHNVQFDRKLAAAALHRCGGSTTLEVLRAKPSYCTMLKSTDLCKLPGNYGSYKWPKLLELHKHLFGEIFDGAHDALEDVRATRRCYYEMRRLGL
jgi:DNA polymerase-3 subunit epsilon